MCTPHLCLLTTSADMTCWHGSTILCISPTPRSNSYVQVRPSQGVLIGLCFQDRKINVCVCAFCVFFFLQELHTASSWTCCFQVASFWRRSNFKPSWSMNLYTTSKFFRQLLKGWVLTKSESPSWYSVVYSIPYNCCITWSYSSISCFHPADNSCREACKREVPGQLWICAVVQEVLRCQLWREGVWPFTSQTGAGCGPSPQPRWSLYPQTKEKPR